MPIGFETFVNDVDMIDLLFECPAPKTKIYKNRFNPMELREKEFRQKYRFSKANMKKLINIVRSDIGVEKRGGHIPVELQVMAAIRYWGRNEIQNNAADIHGFSQSTLCRICERVAMAFASKRPQYVKMPELTSEEIKLMNGFHAISGFPQVIGAIDCTHIEIRKIGGSTGQLYINRKGWHSINTQVICDSSLKIRDMVCRWRGSTHDSRIFSESRIKERLENGEFKGLLLGDAEYACSNILFTPLLNPGTNAETRYNTAHIATHNTVKRCFEVWKQRFRILLTGMRCSLKNTKMTVVALAVLHNLAIDFQDNSIDDDDSDFNADFGQEEDVELLQHNTNQNIARSEFIQQHFE